MRRPLKAISLLGAAIFLVGALAASASAATVPAKVLGSGSDTTYPMMVSLQDLYNASPGCNVVSTPPVTQPLNFACLADDTTTIHGENYPHDQVTEAYPLGSSNGITQLCDQTLKGVAAISFARSSRVPKTTDCTGLGFVGYARDGLTWECWTVPTDKTTSGCKTMGTLNLTQSQLNQIFVTCAITNWSQVGGGNVAMDPYAAQSGSGTRSTWDGFVGGSSSSCLGSFNGQPMAPGSHVSEEQTNQLVDIINPSSGHADQGNAIYYISYGRWVNQYGSGKPDGSALGEVNGIPVNVTTIQNLTFPFGRYLYNVYCKGDPTKSNKCGSSAKSGSQVTRFVGPTGWICKSETLHTNTGKLGGTPDVNPFDGKLYRGVPSGGQPTGDIADAIRAAGFVPLPVQSDGTYCINVGT